MLSPERVGHVLPVCCGHTGHPSSEEAYFMDLHLRAAGFIKNDIVFGSMTKESATSRDLSK